MERAEAHAAFAQGLEQGGDDFLRVLRAGKDALVGLRDELHAVLLEPRHRVGMGEAAQQALHEAVAAGIDALQAAHVAEGVGEVAAAAAGDGHFGERTALCLVEGDGGVRAELLGADGGEAAGGPAR
jgi:hypothetical protein